METSRSEEKAPLSAREMKQIGEGASLTLAMGLLIAQEIRRDPSTKDQLTKAFEEGVVLTGRQLNFSDREQVRKNADEILTHARNHFQAILRTAQLCLDQISFAPNKEPRSTFRQRWFGNRHSS
jgi:hypothetical protein